MSNINEILLLELNKAEQMLAAGKVTGNNINKLTSSGSVRSFNKMNSGLEKGNNNLIKKLNIKDSNELKSKYKPFASFDSSNNPVIHVPKKDTFSLAAMIRGKTLFHSKDLTPAIRRHEIDEIRSLKSTMKKNKGTPSVIGFYHNDKRVGGHSSPKVLQREHKYVSYLSKLNPRYANFEKVRIKSGEYGDNVLKLNSNQLKQLEKKASKHLILNSNKDFKNRFLKYNV